MECQLTTFKILISISILASINPSWKIRSSEQCYCFVRENTTYQTKIICCIYRTLIHCSLLNTLILVNNSVISISIRFGLSLKSSNGFFSLIIQNNNPVVTATFYLLIVRTFNNFVVSLRFQVLHNNLKCFLEIISSVGSRRGSLSDRFVHSFGVE